MEGGKIPKTMYQPPLTVPGSARVSDVSISGVLSIWQLKKTPLIDCLNRLPRQLIHTIWACDS